MKDQDGGPSYRQKKKGSLWILVHDLLVHNCLLHKLLVHKLLVLNLLVCRKKIGRIWI
jgi:hypothetical protein